MIRENTVILAGTLLQDPKIIKDQESQVAEKAYFYMECVERDYKNPALRISSGKKYDEIFVFVNRRISVNKWVTSLEAGDAVIVYGTLSTMRKVIDYCTCCREPIYEEILYVDALDIHKLEFASKDNPKEKMNEHDEGGNQLFLDGVVTNISLENAETKNSFFEFEIKYFRQRNKENLKERDLSEDMLARRKLRTAWVKTYGKPAVEYTNALRPGSEISINGFLSVRPQKKTIACHNCGEILTITSLDSAIIPFSIEYRDRCIIPEGKNETQERTETNSIRN